ncbi:MAG: homocysteine S-methyltransferase family protein [Clostridia bacterium]|nr:homocysteine S-methyltransferase family protein [Clostridia bacterium]
MTLREEIRRNRLYFDGGMGSLLQAAGLRPEEMPPQWNLTHPDVITDLQRQYYAAGARVVTANTFGVNPGKYDADAMDAVIGAAFANARKAAALLPPDPAGPRYAALDVSPLGKLLQPFGDLPFETAVDWFAQTVRCGVRHGADLILIETMNDSYETKAAVLAAKENCDLPIIVCNAYGADGKLMTGADPAAMAALLEGLGVDAYGANCSLGPQQLLPVVRQLLEVSSLPLLVMPNAGLPRVEDDRTVYDVDAAAFADVMAQMAAEGVRMLGGCCGTTPAYIAETVRRTRDIPLRSIEPKRRTVVSSGTRAVVFGADPLCIGERINPTGKKRFKQALAEGDSEYILQEGLKQQQAGVPLLDVNVGLPGIDETATLRDTVEKLQAVVDLPLQIDTASPAAMEAALRCYNGKAMINSVNGKQECMRAVFPLVKKYGGVVVGLTLDEDGIPADAEGRVAIAAKIIETAASYGIGREDIVIDPLCLSVSADAAAAGVTLRAVRLLKERLGVHTVLGVSNISFGLPSREAVNAAFFALALENGLSAAIMNPFSADMQKTYFAYRALRGLDANCADYLAFAAGLTAEAAAAPAPAVQDLQQAVLHGMKAAAVRLCGEQLQHVAPLDVVRDQLIPALDAVGRGVEEKKLYLPQLLMSAEAAGAAFDLIKEQIGRTGAQTKQRPPFVLATVQGDIHDIGKNIVRVVLESYGFPVVDLGKDVPPETVVQAVQRHQAPVCGLSALMTTTVPAMEETIRQLHAQCPGCKVVVGGAVLTREYAARIGADCYAADAMETVRYAEKIIGQPAEKT